MTEKKRRCLLIIFCFLFWEILWYLFFHYSVLFFNFSGDSLLYSLQLVLAKKTSFEQVIKDFYLSHLFIFIGNLLIIPFIIGFYVGRHSDTKKFSNVVLVILLDMGYNLLSNFLSTFNLFALFFFSLVMYMSFPLILAVTYTGATIGHLFPGNRDRAIYLTIYNGILSYSKKGVIVLLFVLLIFIVKLETIDNKIKDWLTPYLHFGYAPVTFNKLPEDSPLLQIRKQKNTEVQDKWSNSVTIENGDVVSVLFYYHNNNYLYTAKNLKLFLKPDKHLLNATLLADNAESLSSSVQIIHTCNHPQFEYLSHSWYPHHSKEPKPLPNDQKGENILKSDGLNLGDVAGKYVGQNYLVTNLKYYCSDDPFGRKKIYDEPFPPPL